MKRQADSNTSRLTSNGGGVGKTSSNPHKWNWIEHAYPDMFGGSTRQMLAATRTVCKLQNAGVIEARRPEHVTCVTCVRLGPIPKPAGISEI